MVPSSTILLSTIIHIISSTSLNNLQEQLDSSPPCGTEIDARSVLANTVAHTHPSLVPLARLVAAHPQEFKSNTFKNASLTRMDKDRNISSSGTFVLHYSCSSEGSQWEPLLFFRASPPPGSTQPHLLTLRLQPFHLDLCSISPCNTKCTWSVHGGLRVLARDCCPSAPLSGCRQVTYKGRLVLTIFNAMCVLVCVVMIPCVVKERRSQHESRGWALMEIFLLGAATLYSIILLDWLPPPYHEYGCGLQVSLRHIGFATFYGSIVLKIYRNLEEYRVRKAQHVSVREEDMLKYLGCMLALTVTGVLAWLAGAAGNERLWKTAWPQCTPHGWAFISHCYELIFLLYGGTLCYKARNSDWLERWQFTVAVCLEVIVTLVTNLIRYSIRYSGNSDTLFTITFVQLQLTVSVNMAIIIVPKFCLISGESSRRSLALGGQSGRAHPSLAKLRDNIINGTIDFAEVPIIDMNPEDIRAELKRVYTQLRMYKLKNLYQDNPHISKRKGGGKRWSDKPKAPRRISVPSCSPQTTKVKIEEDEKSDLTVESAPHNVLLSTSCQLQLEPNSSVRV